MRSKGPSRRLKITKAPWSQWVLRPPDLMSITAMFAAVTWLPRAFTLLSDSPRNRTRRQPGSTWKPAIYYWNSGMFVWRADSILLQFQRHLPEAYVLLRELAVSWNDGGRDEKLRRIYPNLPKISIDYAVMEKADKVLVVEMNCNWVDVGSWPAIQSVIDADASGNVSAAPRVHHLDSRNSIVVSEDEHLIATIGLDDVVIVHSPDATLVCRKGRLRPDQGAVGAGTRGSRRGLLVREAGKSSILSWCLGAGFSSKTFHYGHCSLIESALMTCYLGIDYGTKRTGLAICGTGASFASPLGMIEMRGNLEEQVQAVLKEADEYEVDEFVVGLPLNMDGSEGKQAKATRRFGDLLAKLSGKPAHYWDERLSTPPRPATRSANQALLPVSARGDWTPSPPRQCCRPS